jgi:hypothetical protein
VPNGRPSKLNVISTRIEKNSEEKRLQAFGEEEKLKSTFQIKTSIFLKQRCSTVKLKNLTHGILYPSINRPKVISKELISSKTI